MSLHPSHDDLSNLADAIRITSTPFEYGRLDDWRAELLRAIIALFGGEMGHFDVFGLGLHDESLFVGYPRAVFDEWWSQWAVQDPALPFMESAQLSVYTRRYRYRVAGDHWTARYKRSAVYHEFYRKYGFADAAGLFLRCGKVNAHLHVETGALTDDDADDYTRRLARIVEPALRASLQTVGPTEERSRSPYAVLDALMEPVAVIGSTGRWLHRSRAFDDLFALLPRPKREHLLIEMEQHAARFLTGLENLRAGAVGDIHHAPLWSIDVFSVSATAIESFGGSGRSCFVRVQPRSGVTLEQATAAGLSKREGDVAILLAEGLANKEIAERLRISDHTARRHSESIFRKLGIANRSSVASALRGASRARRT